LAELIFKEDVYEKIGAAIEVHRVLGHCFLEPVYQEALEIESGVRNLPFEPQKSIHIHYKEHLLEKEFVADLVYFGRIIVELKALDELTSREEGQLLNYLKATGMKLGLPINFGSRSRLEWKRFIL
jgi:GxxExxY protein